MRRQIMLVGVAALLVAAACDRSPTRDREGVTPPRGAAFGSATNMELAAARAASARYQDLDAALAAGYVDINVVMQNMGRHFMNPRLANGSFHPDSPQILVYAPQGGRMKLVAVEYAVPLELSAQAPAGFTGDADVWDPNTGFGLWLLHAWVWKPNPDGMFAPFNRTVVLPGL